MKINHISLGANIKQSFRAWAVASSYDSMKHGIMFSLYNTANFAVDQQVTAPSLKQQPIHQQTLPQLKESKRGKDKALIIGFGAICVGAAAALAYNNIRKKIPVITEEILDIDYKKALLKALGAEDKKPDILRSICGKQEFCTFLEENQNNPKIFDTGENLANVRDKIFGANMHIHTTHSDGQMTVKELLDISSSYADKYFVKNNKPFYIGITDHNTVSGCREAVEMIAQNPDKYKNLSVVLGSEINAIVDDTDIHTLVYGINPYEGKIVGFFDNQLSSMQDGVKKTIEKANSIYREILDKLKMQFSFDDMAKIRPSIKTSPCLVNYSMKDYMQFRLIFADLVEGNSSLVDILKKNNVSLDELDFSLPKFNIPQNNLKEPYYLNYIDELKKYILKTAKEKNADCDLSSIEKCFKEISSDVQNALNELEYKTISKDQPLYPKPVSYKSLDDVLEIFREENCLCGIAHPCLTYYAKGGTRDDNPETRKIIEKAFDKFHKKEGLYQRIYEGEYRAYYHDKVSEEYKNFARKLGRDRNFMASGSYDSHRNNPFTNKLDLPRDEIERLIN